MITIHHYLALSAILFSIGTLGVLTRRNAIVIFMCIELMLNAVNLSFISLSHHLGNIDGQVFVFFILRQRCFPVGHSGSELCPGRFPLRVVD